MNLIDRKRGLTNYMKYRYFHINYFRCGENRNKSTQKQKNVTIKRHNLARGGGYSHTLAIRVCAAQRGRDFEAPYLERGIHFRGVL